MGLTGKLTRSSRYGFFAKGEIDVDEFESMVSKVL
jgi:hypothetical protein